MASKPYSAEPDNVPVLTDIIKTGKGRTASKPPAKTVQQPNLFPEPASTAGGKIDRNQLEKLIYKTLHQNLSVLCQQLADSILTELNPDSKAEPSKTGKNKSGR